MKNRIIAALMAAGVLFTAASCSGTPEETWRESPPETQTTTTATTTEADITTETTEDKEQPSSEKVITDAPDIDAQLMLIAANFDFLYFSYYGAGLTISDNFAGGFFAVADLNHNGRLEVLITQCEEYDYFSTTNVFEVSEDCSSLEKFKLNGNDRQDQNGDFSMSTDYEDHIALYDCYLKDGEYYYLIEDYMTDDWENKMIAYFSYSFDGEITRDIIGGCEFHAQKGDGLTTVDTMLHGAGDELFASEEAYLDYMDSYWSGYERQPSCEIKWMCFDWQGADPSADGFQEAVKESYEAFNPDSDVVASITYNYHFVLDVFFSENGSVDIEYVIKDS